MVLIDNDHHWSKPEIYIRMAYFYRVRWFMRMNRMMQPFKDQNKLFGQTLWGHPCFSTHDRRQPWLHILQVDQSHDVAGEDDFLHA